MCSRTPAPSALFSKQFLGYSISFLFADALKPRIDFIAYIHHTTIFGHRILAARYLFRSGHPDL
jgi:hypothetical protein